MAITHLLDTNVLSRLMKEPAGASARRLAELGDEHVCTSIVVACELRYGAALRGSKSLSRAVEEILAALPVLPLDQPSDEHYGDIRTELQRKGTPIGPNDLLIAAQARGQGLTLVTENESEFRRVSALAVENWEA